ncbi:integrase catalytic subunit [Caballeronia hypogeia]|uniref:Integrase catalytic subunit n=1 Tax=Caballeronia hypogeia TaxID=1777140 RepID=A0A158ACL1_9BURK|nr:hypothetical protein [Caballeronia hypogeia]SAK55574.1 integrase catalytic subunit [Caballeronia hypogeia]
MLEIESTRLTDGSYDRPLPLLQGKGDHKRGRYYRYVGHCLEKQVIYLLVVLKHVRVGSRAPRAFTERDVDALHVVPEEIADPQMTGLPEGQLKESWKAGRDRRWPVVHEVILNTARILEDKTFFDATIRDVAEKHKVSVKDLRRWVLTYYARGSIKNGLLERGWAQGKSRTGSRRVTKKLGRPNRLVYEGFAHLEGVNSKRFVPAIRRALETYWIGQNESLRRTWKLMCDNDLARSTKVNGEKIRRRIRPEKTLTVGQFLYRARQLIAAEPELTQRKVGDVEFRQRFEALCGAASDFALWPGDVVDIDATPFNCELVADWDASRCIGKPYVFLAVDRSSSAIVGFFIWYKGESWNAYRQLILMVCCPKDDLLRRHGFVPGEKGDWPIFFVPGAFFLDNCPAGQSKRAKAAIIDRLGTDMIYAPVRHGEAKPQVENHIGIVERAISSHNGAWKREKSLRDRDKRRRSRADATLVHQSFEGHLLNEIIEYNKFAHLPHYLNDDMRDANVNPTPEEMCVWGLKHNRGDANTHWDEATTLRKLLDRKTVTLENGTVHFSKQRYCSHETKELFRKWKRSPGKRRGRGPKITICPLPFTSDKILWAHDDGKFSDIGRDARSVRAYPGQTWSRVERHLQNDCATAILTGFKRKRKGVLGKATTERLARQAKIPVPKKRGSVRSARGFAQAGLEHGLAERDERILDAPHTDSKSVRPSSSGNEEAAPNPTSDGLDELFKAHFLR